jgi:hypothetical protein
MRVSTRDLPPNPLLASYATGRRVGRPGVMSDRSAALLFHEREHARLSQRPFSATGPDAAIGGAPSTNAIASSASSPVTSLARKSSGPYTCHAVHMA